MKFKPVCNLIQTCGVFWKLCITCYHWKWYDIFNTFQYSQLLSIPKNLYSSTFYFALQFRSYLLIPDYSTSNNNNSYYCSLSSREAAEDAGFNVLRVISQPAAAALAYGNLHWPFSDICCWGGGVRIGCWFVSFVIHVQYSSLESSNFATGGSVG